MRFARLSCTGLMCHDCLQTRFWLLVCLSALANKIELARPSGLYSIYIVSALLYCVYALLYSVFTLFCLYSILFSLCSFITLLYFHSTPLGFTPVCFVLIHLVSFCFITAAVTSHEPQTRVPKSDT